MVKNFDKYISLIGGRIRALRCQALSKRSKLQCRKAALKGKRVCMFHGGKSTGPITFSGKHRCAVAKTIHGRDRSPDGARWLQISWFCPWCLG